MVSNRRARVYKVLLYKHETLPDTSTARIPMEHDLSRGFTVTPDGITVVPKNTVVDD